MAALQWWLARRSAREVLAGLEIVWQAGGPGSMVFWGQGGRLEDLMDEPDWVEVMLSALPDQELGDVRQRLGDLSDLDSRLAAVESPAGLNLVVVKPADIEAFMALALPYLFFEHSGYFFVVSEDVTIERLAKFAELIPHEKAPSDCCLSLGAGWSLWEYAPDWDDASNCLLLASSARFSDCVEVAAMRVGQRARKIIVPPLFPVRLA